MKNFNKILLLYYLRLLLLFFISKPPLDYLMLFLEMDTALFGMLWSASLLLLAILILLRVKSYSLSFSADGFSVKKGFVFKKENYIFHKGIRGISYIKSPLEREFSLVSLKVFTCGKSFLLFPLSKESAHIILQKEATTHEY